MNVQFDLFLPLVAAVVRVVDAVVVAVAVVHDAAVFAFAAVVFVLPVSAVACLLVHFVAVAVVAAVVLVVLVAVVLPVEEIPE